MTSTEKSSPTSPPAGNADGKRPTVANKPLRIAYCEGNLDGTVGGSYFSLLYLVTGLDKTEFEPVVVFRRDHPFLDRYREAGIRTVVMPINVHTRATGAGDVHDRRGVLGKINAKYRAATSFFRLFVFDSIRVAWWLLRNRIRLVHLNNSVTRLHSWMLAARIVGVPCISHERGLNTRYSRMSRYFAPRLDRVICISQAVQDNLAAHGVASLNTTVVHNGLDPAIFEPTRAVAEIRHELGLEADAPLIGMVGNIREWKGQDVVVRAMGCLVKNHPDLTCVFVGGGTESDRPFRTRIEGLVHELGISEHVIFAGYKDDPANWMNAMDIVVHASVNPEPFGRVLIEAMALGKPLVGARAGAVPEIVDEPRCGLTFAPGDHHGLYTAVSALLSDEQQRLAMGAAGRQRARDSFGIERNVQGTQNIYREVLQLRTGKAR